MFLPEPYTITYVCDGTRYTQSRYVSYEPPGHTQYQVMNNT